MHAVLRSEDASETVSVSVSRDVRNRFFNFGSVSVRFLKKTLIRFGMNLVRFGLQKLGSDSYLLLT